MLCWGLVPLLSHFLLQVKCRGVTLFFEVNASRMEAVRYDRHKIGLL